MSQELEHVLVIEGVTRIVGVWPSLPVAVRAGIIAMVAAVAPKPISL